MLTRGIWHLVTKRWTLKRSFSMIKDVNLPSMPARINSCALGAADLQHPLKGGHSGKQKQGICALGTTGRPGLQLVGYSQELILRAQVLYCLLYRKAQTFCMVTTVSRDKQKLQETSRKSLEKICAWLHDLPLHQKNHIYPDLAPAASLEYPRDICSSPSQPSEVLSPGLPSSICSQIKLKSQLWRRTIFFSQRGGHVSWYPLNKPEFWTTRLLAGKSEPLQVLFLCVEGECLYEARRETPSPPRTASWGERN